MNTPLTVAIADESIGSTASAVISSLPVFFRPVGEGRPDVLAVAGSPAWVDSAVRFVSNGVSAIVVFNPSPAAPEAVEALLDGATAAGTRVVLAEPFAASPALTDLVKTRPNAVVGFSAINSTSRSAGLAPLEQLLEQVRVVRAITGSGVSIRSITTGHASAVAVATLAATDSATVVNLLATRASRTDVSVRAHSFTAALEVELPAPDTARPATVTIVDADGETRRPTIYESAHRAAWRSLAEQWDAPVATLNDAVRTFAADLRSVAVQTNP